jgi:hypothetical protein
VGHPAAEHRLRRGERARLAADQGAIHRVTPAVDALAMAADRARGAGPSPEDGQASAATFARVVRRLGFSAVSPLGASVAAVAAGALVRVVRVAVRFGFSAVSPVIDPAAEAAVGALARGVRAVVRFGFSASPPAVPAADTAAGVLAAVLGLWARVAVRFGAEVTAGAASAGAASATALDGAV